MSGFPRSLWEFSLSVYAQPGMERLCLQLQDHRQLNINALLWALWLDEQQRPFCADLWQQGLSRAAPWQRWWVRPLRNLRRALPKRHPWLGIRIRVQQWELHGERKQLQSMQAVSDGFDFTRGGNQKEPADRTKKADRPQGSGRYVLQLVDAEGETYDQLLQVMANWRQQLTERSR